MLKPLLKVLIIWLLMLVMTDWCDLQLGTWQTARHFGYGGSVSLHTC